MEKHIIFSYYEKDLYPANPTAVRYTLWSDGTVEKQDNLINMDDTKEVVTTDLDAAKKVTDFIYTNQEIINSIPANFSNDDVENGMEIEIQFNNKIISGNNILTAPIVTHPNHTHISNMINLMEELKHTVKVIH